MVGLAVRKIRETGWAQKVSYESLHPRTVIIKSLHKIKSNQTMLKFFRTGLSIGQN